MRLTRPLAPVFIAATLGLGAQVATAQAAPAPGTNGTTEAAASGTAASIHRGKILSQTCAFCHGLPDYVIPYPSRHVPFVGGQHATYVISALHEYAQGDRAFATMKAQGASLTDRQIRDIAAYLASLGPETPISDEDVKAPPFAASCAACHGASGVSTNPMYPTLAGQHYDYLLLSLKEYKAGKRKNGIMNAMASPLTLEQMQQLAHYYSKQPSPLVLMPLQGPE
ncbi:MAG: c-type cytochrome [Gammaproteobacteria bacterium]|nr:c-type cytochrome [Gammaproteobacteria bacterium]